jgi:hypothetical protein
MQVRLAEEPVMGMVKPPNYLTGRKGKRWTISLKAAAEKGAVIIVEDVGVTVTWQPREGSRAPFRPWVDSRGNRYDSRDCIPCF